VQWMSLAMTGKCAHWLDAVENDQQVLYLYTINYLCKLWVIYMHESLT